MQVHRSLSAVPRAGTKVSCLSFYTVDPAGTITAAELEPAVIDRLRLLNSIETARLMGNEGPDMERVIRRSRDEFMPNTPAGCQKDQHSHFALRLACCGASAPAAHWLIRNEATLFQYRFVNNPPHDGTDEMISTFAPEMTVLPTDQAAAHRKELLKAFLKQNDWVRDERSFERNTHYTVAEHQAGPEVTKLVRQKYLHTCDGFVYVRSDVIDAYLVHTFREHLSRRLLGAGSALGPAVSCARPAHDEGTAQLRSCLIEPHRWALCDTPSAWTSYERDRQGPPRALYINTEVDRAQLEAKYASDDLFMHSCSPAANRNVCIVAASVASAALLILQVSASSAAEVVLLEEVALGCFLPTCHEAQQSLKVLLQTWSSDGPSKETLHGLEHERERRVAEVEETDQRHAEMDALFKADERLRKKRCVFCAIPGCWYCAYTHGDDPITCQSYDDARRENDDHYESPWKYYVTPC